jgi:hypothetical protein
MRFSQIISETSAGATGSGSVATVSSPLGATQSRGNPSIYGGQKVGNLFKGKKTNKPFANSLSEGAVKQLSMDLKGGKDGLSDEEFKKKYGKTKAEIRADMKNKPEPAKKVEEAKLEEEDRLLKPGMGHKFKPGFHKIDPDKAEREGETLKNSLHTIIRVATELDKQLSTKDNFPEWVSEKIGATKGMMVAVAEYLQSSKEMQHDDDAMDECGGVIAGGLQYEGLADTIKKGVKNIKRGIQGWDKNLVGPGGEKLGDPKEIVKRNKKYSDDTTLQLAKRKELGFPFGGDSTTGEHTPRGLQRKVLDREIKKRGLAQEGAKVDRMVGHIKKSEKKLGHSSKEAENIAWATANKRGMLDNKNKKK